MIIITCKKILLLNYDDNHYAKRVSKYGAHSEDLSHYLVISDLQELLANTYTLKYILVDKVFANGSGDQNSILAWVIPKTQKILLYGSLFNTLQL